MKQKRRTEQIFAQIAARHGVSVAEVKRDMQQGIDLACCSDDPEIKAFYAGFGQRPTPEKLIRFFAEPSRMQS